MKPFLLFVLSTCLISMLPAAHGNYLRALIPPEQEPAYLSEGQKDELIQQTSCMCNPVYSANATIDCDPFFNRQGSCRIISRSEYTAALEAIFYPRGPWDEQECSAQKCCVETQRCGCNGCTFAACLMPIALPAACTACAGIVASCVTNPSHRGCENSCADPQLHDFITNNIATPSVVTVAAILPTAVLSYLYGSLCLYRLSDLVYWDETGDAPTPPRFRLDEAREEA